MAGAPSKTILVVEDDPSVRKLLARALSPLYHVVEAVDGADAMQIVNGMDPPPNLVICDVMMPKVTGYALARLLKADDRLRSIPIIFLTARTSPKDVVEGINAGARHYVAKPFALRDVLDKVAKILK